VPLDQRQQRASIVRPAKPSRDCASARKSIPRDKLEGEFVQIVARLQPSESMVTLAHVMFKDAWDQRLAQGKARKRI
jgi:hypothetical protein